MLFARKHPPDMRERARRMFEEGALIPMIGRALDLPPRTVRSWAQVEGWAGPQGVAPADPVIRKPSRRSRAARLEDRQRAYDDTWGVVLSQLAVVMALPGATPSARCGASCFWSGC